jgi:PAS domain S-box-containing protein
MNKVKEEHNSLELEKIDQNISDYKFALDESCIVTITDQKGIIQYVNDNFCYVSKFTKEELIGQDHRITNSGHHSKHFIQEIWSTIASAKIWRGDLKNKAKDGTFYWVQTTIIPFLNNAGKPYKYMAVRSDITNQIHLQEKLDKKTKQQIEELTKSLAHEKEINEKKSHFVSFASHEFRSPLTAILSSLSLIESYNKPEQEEKKRKHIHRISSCVTNLTEILNDFLKFGELEEGDLKITYCKFNLPEFIHTIIEEMDGMIQAKNQQIIYCHKGDSVIEQSEKTLRNILYNLLSNASKYSPNENEIQLASSIIDNKGSISIKDKGIGIPKEEHQKVFSQAFRAGNAKDIQGTGLGLTIVKKYVELIGGKIDFTSELGEGTTFTIEFDQR